MKEHFLKNKTEYKIGLLFLLVWGIIALIGWILKVQTYPVGYFQKIAFGAVATVIGFTIFWYWFEKTFPGLKKIFDPDNWKNIDEKLTTWQKVSLAFGLMVLFVASYVLLTALY